MTFFKKGFFCQNPSTDVSYRLKKVALVGNPNVGKSVLFNALTGSYVTVSNYPGTSVEVTRGTASIKGQTFEIIDTPGMYSLLPITEEERVARKILIDDPPNIVIHVVDARNLERMLTMTLQLIEAGLPVMLVVNIMDEAEHLGITIDIPMLERKLGIPVVGAALTRKRGLPEILESIVYFKNTDHVVHNYSSWLESNIAGITGLMRSRLSLSPKAVALQLLQRDREVTELVRAAEGEGFAAIEAKLREKTYARRGSFHLDLSLERKVVTEKLLEGVFHAPDRNKVTLSEKLSSWTVRPLTGVPLLFIVLYCGLYQFVGVFGAGTLVEFLEGTIFEKYFNPWISEVIRDIIPWAVLQGLFVGEYGIITLGLRYAVGIILPIVATFFLFFSVLEDSGYFPRLALLVDRLFKNIGLTGRAVIPMVLGFGCGTMATMVTRTLETRRERIIATVLLALAIPCSAQLGVIMALLSRMPGALIIWFICLLLIFLGVGLLAAHVIPGESAMFYMELPPLRLPQLENTLTKTYNRIRWYVWEIVPLFILASVLIWVGKITCFFDKAVNWLAPVMATIGLPKEVAVSFIFGFFRRDYGAAGLYDLQSKGLLNPRQLTVAAVTLTLFIPCIAQFLIMTKERGIKAAIAIGVFVSLLAFGCGYLLNKILASAGVL